MQPIRGRVHKFGDDLDTDVIIPAQYLASYDPAVLARKCMEPIDPDFHTRVSPGDVLVGGENFGCGSSREHAVLALIGTGLSCIIAKSFARIFFRNCINQGLPVLIAPETAAAAGPGDEIEVEPREGRITLNGSDYAAQPLPEEVMTIVRADGLVAHARALLQADAS